MASFSRRHYEAVAKVFKDNKPADNWDANKRLQHNLLLRDLVRVFRRDNDGFKPDRFIAAAGGEAAE